MPGKNERINSILSELFPGAQVTYKLIRDVKISDGVLDELGFKPNPVELLFIKASLLQTRISFLEELDARGQKPNYKIIKDFDQGIIRELIETKLLEKMVAGYDNPGASENSAPSP